MLRLLCVVLVSLCLASCRDGSAAKQKPLPPPTQDRALRAYLGVQSVWGTYQVPRDCEGIIIAPLKFEDGKFIGTSGHIEVVLPAEKSQLPEKIGCELLVSSRPKEGEPSIVLVGPGVTAPREDSFWMKAWGDSSCGPRTTLGEYTLLGWTASAATRDGKQATTGGGRLKENLATRRYVGVLAVRSFANAGECHALKFDEEEAKRINELLGGLL